LILDITGREEAILLHRRYWAIRPPRSPPTPRLATYHLPMTNSILAWHDEYIIALHITLNYFALDFRHTFAVTIGIRWPYIFIPYRSSALTGALWFSSWGGADNVPCHSTSRPGDA
jgi:hypothetical protein